MSPTARTLKALRDNGWIAEVVEQRIPRTFITRDFLGVIDIIAVSPTLGILGVQATSGGTGGHHSHRRAKILAEPRVAAWLAAGGKLEVWSWAKRGARGKDKEWTARVEQIESGGAEPNTPAVETLSHQP